MSTPPPIDPALLSNCTVATCPILTSYYNYRISLPPNILFLTIFSFSYLVYLSIYILTRRCLFFMLTMTSGIACEVVGYTGRVMSYSDQWDQNGFLMQIVCLTIAPAFFSAGIYLCLGWIVEVYGGGLSRVRPKWFTRIFIPCDVISMVLQGAGAGIASVALTNGESLVTGDNVIIAGLATQVFTMFVFMGLGVDFGLRVKRSERVGEYKEVQDSWKFKGFLVALAIATICVFWRSVYRVAELNQGWNGPLTFRQDLFVGFEGALMAIAVVSLSLFHPAICMSDAMDGAKGQGLRREVDESAAANEESKKDKPKEEQGDGSVDGARMGILSIEESLP